jgi:hypothetical protein
MLDENKEKCFAKVGYTSDRRKGEHNSRVAAYRTHNPCAILKDWHAGSKNDERLKRNRLLKMKDSKKITNSEWVEVSEDTYNQLLLYGFDAIK